MDKKFFKRWMPDPKTVQDSRYFRWIGKVLHAPNLWHLNRNSVARGASIGMFWAMIPMPLQTVPAVLMAVWWRGNVGIAVAATFISNVLTIPPLFFVSYRVGAFVMGRHDPAFSKFNWNLAGLFDQMKHIWWPLLLGAIIIGIVSAIVTYYIVQIGWKLKAARSHHRRKERRLAYRALRRGHADIGRPPGSPAAR